MKVKTEIKSMSDVAKEIFEVVQNENYMGDFYFTGIFTEDEMKSLQYKVLEAVKIEMGWREYCTDAETIQLFLSELVDWSIYFEKYEFTQLFKDISSNLSVINFCERELISEVMNDLLHEKILPLYNEIHQGEFRKRLTKGVQEETGFPFELNEEIYTDMIDSKLSLLKKLMKKMEE